MTSPFGTLVLRDAPESSAQHDLLVYECKAGLWGVRQVPAGVHYLSLQANGAHTAFWYYLRPGEVIVKVFSQLRQQFEDDEEESTAHYREMALSGAMDDALVPYDTGKWVNWWRLTRHISPSEFPPILHQEAPGESPSEAPAVASAESIPEHHKSRFEQVLFGTHGGDSAAFLAEFQFAFVRWLASGEDAEAFTRWRYLLLSIYNAGERGITLSPHFFTQVIDSLVTQFDYLPDSMLTSDSFVTQQAGYLAEDMIDSEIAEVVEKGREFTTYMNRWGMAL